MISIYHNPRCSKSREGLAILEKSGKQFEVIKYLEDIPTYDELRNIITILGISVESLVRKNEIVWKEKFKGKRLSEEDILKAMICYPVLIERPIVVNGTKAVIGRPADRIKTII